MILTAHVITVSDSVAAGRREDQSGPAVRDVLEHAGWSVTSSVVPDVADEISALFLKLANSAQVRAVFTTGGTGIAARDVTPEATKAVIDRELPGIAEWMRASGRQSTPLAILSRAVVGTRGPMLIVNLPGSPKGAVQSLEAIL